MLANGLLIIWEHFPLGSDSVVRQQLIKVTMQNFVFLHPISISDCCCPLVDGYSKEISLPCYFMGLFC